MTEPTLLLDANVLLALGLGTHARHREAHEHFARMASWATTPLTESAFVRLMLNPTITIEQRTSVTVLAQLRAMRSDSRWRFLADDSSLAEPQIDTRTLVGHRQVTDFHLVNLAKRHGARLATFDADLFDSLIKADRAHVHLLGV